LALVQELALDLYPMAEVKALVKAQQWALVQELDLASVHLWFRNLELDPCWLANFAPPASAAGRP